ncbi:MULTISPECIES: 3-phosphoshikimate 1-carboxyvinyltransferase [Bifidobacterium]|uniref:3-phosphoshikimate 1-carboxyvinyltransferase n=1 Tax=Bifidobacterium TaxID=1678 RepID=UPI0018DB34B8|nr:MULTISPECIES: 3-phosphoshikimate 1-carboxyvinyltransferase [Bifidobacterium]MBH9979688.1 3-phosphoshikimate 1-carboxyvinyltransferase [Bifidobacterium asteroides]MBI0099068.1 3-phosphoshikimate 1-carboxyvinyltransferase [Bifidobacterium sp. W8114]
MVTMTAEETWEAPQAGGPLDATVTIPGSKSLSNRYLILAALGSRPVRLTGLLRSRDTDLMIAALEALGVDCRVDLDDPTNVTVIPPAGGRFRGGARVDCGLAGTVMRFVPGLAMLADAPTRFDGDKQAYRRPMRPLLDGLTQLGARIEYLGQEGFLPFVLTPPAHLVGGEVTIDSSASSQFISGLLLLAARADGPTTIVHSGQHLPSLPHIAMTVEDLRQAGVQVQANPDCCRWSVEGRGPAGTQLPDQVQVEPDLSNAAPFLGAALIGGGQVSVPMWPERTTQPGGLLPKYLETMGAKVDMVPDGQGSATCRVTGGEAIHGLGDFDLSPAGEIVPSIAAILVFADCPSRLHGIGHLRGHETNRLKALATEIARIGGQASELDDGLAIEPVPTQRMHGAVMETYADHRMATFAAMIGLKIPGIRVRNIGTTAKTLPDFPGMWKRMLAGEGQD